MKAAQLDGTSDETNPINVFGIRWATTTDHLSLSLNSLHHNTSALTTKREVLKDASDLLGITISISVRAKLFIQKL